MSKDNEHSPGHPMREVTRVSGGHGGDTVVAWCPICGAVAVDLAGSPAASSHCSSQPMRCSVETAENSTRRDQRRVPTLSHASQLGAPRPAVAVFPSVRAVNGAP